LGRCGIGYGHAIRLEIMREIKKNFSNAGRFASSKSECYISYNYSLFQTFARVLNAECFLPGNSPTSELYMPTFRNTLFHLHRQVGVKNELGLRMLGYYTGKRLARK